MPHRKNAKGDIGGAKRFSDSYDMDNIYLSEEGWVYRHFKNSERTLWWDEIIVAGQVKPGMVIHEVSNNPVVPTNPLKLGTAGDPTDGAKDYTDGNWEIKFEDGDKEPDYRYSDHERALDKVTTYTNMDSQVAPLYERIDFEETAWESINVDTPDAEYLNPDETQVPNGWSGVSSPSDVETYPDEPPYEGEEYQSVNHYTVAPEVTPQPYNGKGDPAQKDSEVIVGVFADGVEPATTTDPQEPEDDYIPDEDVLDAFGAGTDGPVEDNNDGVAP